MSQRSRSRALMCCITIVGVLAVPAAPAAAARAGDSGSTTPRWVLHAQRFRGQSGVKTEVASGRVAPPSGTRPAAVEPSVATSPGNNLQLNNDTFPPMPQNETSVVASLDNPMIAVAAANDYIGGLTVVVMRTADGGKSWTTVTRISPQLPTREVCNGGDPWLAYSVRDHAFFLSSLCFFRERADSELHVFMSVDEGQTWTPGRQAAVAASNRDRKTGVVDPSFDLDKEAIDVDNDPSSPYFGRLYMGYASYHVLPDGSSDYCNAKVSYTDDIPPANPALARFHVTSVQPDGAGSTAQFVQPLVEPGGALDLTYVSSDCNSSNEHHLYLQKSTNGGRTFHDPIRIDKPGRYVGTKLQEYPGKVFRGGTSPSLAYNAATHTLAYAYTNLVAHDTSGINVTVQTSEDGGRNWSDPRWLSITADGSPAPNDQFMPGIAADPTGAFHAIWYDNRRDPANHLIDTFHAVSYDNGVTWVNDRISTKSWDPDKAHLDCGCFIGDYIQVAASQASLYPTWMDGRDSAFDQTGIGEGDIFSAYLPF